MEMVRLAARLKRALTKNLGFHTSSKRTPAKRRVFRVGGRRCADACLGTDRLFKTFGLLQDPPVRLLDELKPVMWRSFILPVGAHRACLPYVPVFRTY